MSQAKDALTILIGRAAELALPGLSREIDENRNTGRAARLKRAILRARLARAHSKGDTASIEDTLAAFWKGNAGDRFHEHHSELRFQLFLDQHAGAIDALADVLQGAGADFHRLVEIGCGDGAVLDYCVERLPQIREAVGLDVNAEVIARTNAARPSDDRCAFFNAEAGDWLAANPRPGTVMLSNGGVLEYFSQESFDGLLRTLAAAAPAAMVLIEPVAAHHDLDRQPQSFVFGEENSFSHNHRRRLSEAGFRIAFEREVTTPGIRWMLMVGLHD
ncbi:MAG TPA: class I SAM-dependent methyltransferase [Phenylobacterium sp.]|nr:class I SAM-dependent methyltransferase [Phenylobacterium sp.]